MNNINSPIYQLDAVLGWIVDEFNKYSKKIENALHEMTGKTLDNSMTEYFIKEHFIKSHAEFENLNTFNILFPLLIKKLSDDNYLQEKDGKYSITFEGKVFSEKGGYRKQERRENSKIVLDYTISVMVAVGTMGLLIFEIIKCLMEPCP